MRFASEGPVVWRGAVRAPFPRRGGQRHRSGKLRDRGFSEHRAPWDVLAFPCGDKSFKDRGARIIYSLTQRLNVQTTQGWNANLGETMSFKVKKSELIQTVKVLA